MASAAKSADWPGRATGSGTRKLRRGRLGRKLSSCDRAEESLACMAPAPVLCRDLLGERPQRAPDGITAQAEPVHRRDVIMALEPKQLRWPSIGRVERRGKVEGMLSDHGRIQLGHR